LVPQKYFPAGARRDKAARNCCHCGEFTMQSLLKEADMGFGRGALLWLIGIPLPIILLLALFMHH
jgi:hypothetical protein